MCVASALDACSELSFTLGHVRKIRAIGGSFTSDALVVVPAAGSRRLSTVGIFETLDAFVRIAAMGRLTTALNACRASGLRSAFVGDSTVPVLTAVAGCSVAHQLTAVFTRVRTSGTCVPAVQTGIRTRSKREITAFIDSLVADVTVR